MGTSGEPRGVLRSGFGLARAALLLASAFGASACGAAAPSYGADDPSHGMETPPPEKPKEPEAPPAPPEDIVLRAARPFHGERAEDGARLGSAALMRALSQADAICVGERHDDPSDHYAQLAVLRGLIERHEIGGFELGLGLEMFEQDQQEALDKFASGRLSLNELVTQSKYEERWGFPIQFYAPQLEAAQHAKSQLIALNVSRALTRAVAEGGIESLPPEVREDLPELDLFNPEHRALFDSLMAGHPVTGDSKQQADTADHLYQAQVVWDESMAARAAEWLRLRAPARKMVIFAGLAHCHRSAIPSRLAKRVNARVVSVLPVLPSGDQGRPNARALPADPHAAPAAEALAPGAPGAAETVMRAGYDYRLVFE
jgi:uncharacterized iron-regulated protein